MKSTVIALTFTRPCRFWDPLVSPHRRTKLKVARGSVAAIWRQVGDGHGRRPDMTFAVDSKTLVEARGGSTKTGQAQAAGKPDQQLNAAHRGRDSRSPSPQRHGRRASRHRHREIPKSASGLPWAPRRKTPQRRLPA
jgi:hypothetical protein